MEFINVNGTREPIPDAVVSASDNRDLVASYLAATPDERARIHRVALAAVTPPPAAPVSAADAPNAAAPAVWESTPSAAPSSLSSPSTPLED